MVLVESRAIVRSSVRIADEAMMPAMASPAHDSKVAISPGNTAISALRARSFGNSMSLEFGVRCARGHPEGASTSAHPLCCRLLTYARYVGEPAPRICALVNAPIRRYKVMEH